MPWDVTVFIEDRPGGLARVGEAAAEAGINLEGACASVCEGRGVVHLLVEEGNVLAQILEVAGFQIAAVQEVPVAFIEDRPGALAEVCRRLANEGVNLDVVYVARGNRLVVIGDPPELIRRLI
jgi:hypothetical protein